MRSTKLVLVTFANDARSTVKIAHEFIAKYETDVDLIIVLSEHQDPPAVCELFDRVRYLRPPPGIVWTEADAHRQISWELSRGYSGQPSVVWIHPDHLDRVPEAAKDGTGSRPLAAATPTEGRPHRMWWRFARPLVRPAGLTSVCTLGSVAVALLYPWPLKIAVDGINGTAWMGLERPTTIAAVMAAASLVLVLVGAAFDYGSTLISGRAAERASAEMRGIVVRRLLHMPMPFFDRYSSGELLSRLNGDVDRVQDGMLRVLTSVIPEAVTLIGMAIVLFLIDPVLALAALVAAPLLAITTLAKRKRTDRLQRESRRRQGELSSTASDLLRNARAIQGLGAEPWAATRYQDRTDRAVDASIRSLEYSARFSPVTDLILATTSATVLWLGVTRVSSGQLTVGSLLVVFSYLSGLYSPVRELARVGNVMARTAASRDRLGEILRHPLPPERLLGERTTGTPGIAIEALSFAYGDDADVLNDVTLRVGDCEHVCIMGPSGIGKTTLLHLLVRLYEPTAGTIKVSGVDVRDRPMGWLRSRVALVPQDCWILDATLRENLALDTPNVTDQQIDEVVRIALLDDVVERLQDGLETRLGEGGSRLSGGQRRRVALARALLRGADVLLLDEPTSGLDAASERRIAESIRAVSQYRSVLTVTHSPAIASIADRVLSLENGQLVPFIGATAARSIGEDEHELAS